MCDVISDPNDLKSVKLKICTSMPSFLTLTKALFCLKESLAGLGGSEETKVYLNMIMCVLSAFRSDSPWILAVSVSLSQFLFWVELNMKN